MPLGYGAGALACRRNSLGPRILVRYLGENKNSPKP